MARIIKADGTEIEFDISKLTDENRLAKLQKVVGGLIEIIYVFDEQNKPKIMVLNDEGKLIGLPRNSKATEIAEKTIGVYDAIMGDVIICDSEEIP
jgi:hypothetical protein